MKRVVLVGSDFSPSSLPPALRLRFFASHLPEFGWQPTVLTVQPRYYEAAVDPENDGLLPEWLEVIHTAAIPQRVSHRVGIGDIGLRSLAHQALALDRLCRQGGVDLVFIPIPPNFPVLLGRLMYARHGVPYVVDYIDPWVDDYYARLPVHERPGGYKWRLSYMLARFLEPVALRHAAHIVGVSRSYTAPIVARYPWLADTDHTGIPYGGEPGDVAYVRRHPRQNLIFQPDDGALHISYVGRGGADMERTLRAVFAAVREGLDLRPELFGRLRLHFVGTTYDPHWDGVYEILPRARDAGVEALVSEHPPRVPYLDALQVMLDSHALLAIGSDQPHYTASKIFPFILTQRPLLAVFHRDSTVIEILAQTGAGDAVTFGDEGPGAHISTIREHLIRLLSLPAGSRPATRWDAFDQYTTRTMTRRLATIFDEALNAAPTHGREDRTA